MSAHATLAGRLREQQRLAGLLTAVSAGEAGMVLVHGEAGIGKTRLAAAVTATVEGCQVLSGRCLRLTASVAPYLPLVTALDTWIQAHPDAAPAVMAAAPALVPLLPTLADSRPPGGAARDPAHDDRVLPAWERALRAMTDQEPVVLVIDDLQWADASSLDVLSYLVAGLARQRLLVLATYRDTDLADGDPLHAWLADLHRLPHVQDLPLSRFTVEETRAQVRLLTGADPDPALLEVLHRRSRGNPYLTELLVRHGATDPTEAETTLPEELRRAVLAGWHRLPGPARALARVVAVAGRPVDPDLLARVATARGAPHGDLAAHLHAAAAAGVLGRGRDGRVWFRHPLIAEVLYGDLLPGERRALHLAFADGGPVDPDDVMALGEHARHCEEAGRTDEAFTHLLRAAEAADRVQAYRERAAFYRRAGDLWPVVSASVRDRHGPEVTLLLTAARAVRWAGDERAALRLAERAWIAVDAAVDPVTAGHALTWWTELTYTCGVVDAYPVSEFEQAVALTATSPDSAEHSRALADLSNGLVWRGDRVRAREIAEAAVQAARRSRVATATAYALYARSLARFGEDGAAEDAAESHRLAEASGDLEHVALACIARANAAEGLGDVPGCAAAALDGYRAATRVGLSGLTPYLASVAGHALLFRGDLDRVDRLTREVLAARPVGVPAVQAHGVALSLAVRRGDLAAAARHRTAVEDEQPEWRGHAGLRVPTAVAELLVAGGEAHEALRVLESTLLLNCAADPPYGDTMLVWAARAAAQLTTESTDPGQRAAARETLTRIVEARRRLGTPFAAPGRNRFNRAQEALFVAHQASLTVVPGRAVGCWRTAMEEAAQAGCGYLHAEARYRLAEALVDAGHRVDAAVELRGLHREATAMGALALTNAAAALARRARVDLSDPDPPPAATGALAGLTRREREVLAYLLAGRSYAEIARELFISEKTVSVHVSNLLRKTGTANRTAAAVWARDHGI